MEAGPSVESRAGVTHTSAEDNLWNTVPTSQCCTLLPLFKTGNGRLTQTGV